jgi:putative membrane protein
MPIVCLETGQGLQLYGPVGCLLFNKQENFLDKSFAIEDGIMKKFVSMGLVLLSITFVKVADAAGNQLVPGDKKFVLAVAADGMTEVKLGEIARERATSPSVKEFAAQMVSDHSKADDDLKAIAVAHALPVPVNLDTEHQKTVDKLARLNGAEFDQTYIDQMIDAHKKAVAALEAEQDTKQADLKDWTDSTLPTIKHHLGMVLSLKAKVPKAL